MESRHALMRTYRRKLEKCFQQADWPLLLFLVLFLNVKLYVKAAAVILAVCIHWKTWKGHDSRNAEGPSWQKFYVSMLLLAMINALLSVRGMSLQAWMAFGLGCVYWLLAIAAARLVFLFVRRGDKQKIHATLTFFFLLNAGVMLLSLVRVCIRAGVFNPYNYEGEHRRFFISTGDLITGIGLDGSVTAALTGAFGVLYFLYRGRRGNALLCYVTTLLATSNAVNYLLGVVLVMVLLLYSDRLQKSMVIIFLGMLVIFSAKVSPSNQQYASNLLGRVTGRNAYEEPVPIPNAKWTEFVESRSMTEKEDKLHACMDRLYLPGQVDSMKRQYTGWRFSGRKIAWEDLGRFYREHPGRLWLGTGMGNFSSQLAFRTTGLGIQGGYPLQWAYIHPFFREHYLFIYLYYHSRDEGQHSVINKPDSVYGQVLAEYGLAGIGCFFVFYLGFWGRVCWRRPVRSVPRSYGLPLLLLMAGAFFTEYWFEQLSVVILFELLMLLDKESTGMEKCIPKSPY